MQGCSFEKNQTISHNCWCLWRMLVQAPLSRANSPLCSAVASLSSVCRRCGHGLWKSKPPACLRGYSLSDSCWFSVYFCVCSSDCLSSRLIYLFSVTFLFLMTSVQTLYKTLWQAVFVFFCLATTLIVNQKGRTIQYIFLFSDTPQFQWS